MHYKYCPQCGNKLIEKPAGDDGNVPFCENCNQYWFDTFSDCIIILVYNEFNEVVLARQEYLSTTSAVFTSGYISPGETAEEAAIREVKEEIGVDIKKVEYVGTYWFNARDQLMHGFIGFAPKCELVLSQEVDSAEWFPVEDVPKYMTFRSKQSSTSAIYEYYLKKCGLPVV